MVRQCIADRVLEYPSACRVSLLARWSAPLPRPDDVGVDDWDDRSDRQTRDHYDGSPRLRNERARDREDPAATMRYPPTRCERVHYHNSGRKYAGSGGEEHRQPPTRWVSVQAWSNPSGAPRLPGTPWC